MIGARIERGGQGEGSCHVPGNRLIRYDGDVGVLVVSNGMAGSMDFEMQFWDGLREWASQCLDFWKDVGSLGATSGGSRGTGLESLGFVTTALMSYWLVLLILVARGIIGMNEQGRYIAHAERYERTMATLGDSRRRQDGRWVAYYEASIDGSRRKLRWESSLEPTPEANLWYEPGTAHGWVEGNAYDPHKKWRVFAFVAPLVGVIVWTTVTLYMAR